MQRRTVQHKVNGKAVDELKKVMAVYSDRGHQALELLSEMKIESAEEVLSKRKAAFHNFRSKLHFAELTAIDENHSFISEVQRVVKLDEEIEEAMRHCQAMLLKDFQKLSEGRRRMVKFQSKRHFSKGFEQSA